MRIAALLLALPLAACATSDVATPELAELPAESIDPRLPVTDPDAAPVPVDPPLAARLAELVAEAQAGARAFDILATGSVPEIEAAGEPGSESWTRATELLSRLDAARAPVASAMADADALATGAIAEEGWVNPSDRDAIAAAAAEIAALDAREAALIDRLTGTLRP